MTSTYSARKELGDRGEELAVRELRRQGLVVVDRNWRCNEGEIDIVAQERRTLVICEVKTRTSDRFGSPFEAISTVKAARLYRLARAWAAAHSCSYDRIRVDVIGIRWRSQDDVDLQHVRGVS